MLLPLMAWWHTAFCSTTPTQHHFLRFLLTGVMAQLIAMRIHSDDVYGCKLIALHPSSHLLHHEYDAFEHVWRMRHIRVGDPNRVLTVADVRQALANFRYDCAVMIFELPQVCIVIGDRCS